MNGEIPPIADPTGPPGEPASPSGLLPDSPRRNWLVVLGIAGFTLLLPIISLAHLFVTVPAGLFLLNRGEDDYHRGLGRSLLIGAAVSVGITLLGICALCLSPD